jgi:hypothetical protein
MCLTSEGHNHYYRLTRNLDDEKLLDLDAFYRQNCGTSVDWELHGMVLAEIHRRRQFRRGQLKRSLWLSSRRGQFIEALKRWLISRGLWSSAAQERKRPRSLIDRLLILLWQNLRSSRALTINTLPGRQTPLEQL